jgi:signal transduction histidine kinase
MNDFKKFSSNLTMYGFFWISISGLLGVGTFLLFRNMVHVSEAVALLAAACVVIIFSFLAAKLLVLAASEPLKAVWQAVQHINPKREETPAPDTANLTHGRDLAGSMVDDILDLSGQAAPVQQADLLEVIPLPLIALSSDDHIVLINKLAAAYLGRPAEELMGKGINDVLQLSFQGKDTFENWLLASKQNSVAASQTWDHVRLQLPDDKGIHQFDLAAHYNKGNQSGYDTLLMLFDHTTHYGTEDTRTSYVALAVHELRTPLTVLRGYIEVFEDELGAQLTPELRDFMHKMSASAQTLTAFVSNILNVARVDENQLTLSLHEANWNELLPEIVRGIELRAKVRGKTLELDIQPNLPSVAVDKVSIYEVVSNLLDNAIKYSGESTKIIIHASSSKDGAIETVIQDFGVGIPASSVKELFTRFYRGHRSKAMISGSGLGLYLVKAIVTAHGGNVWVNSHEGEGSSFGFSLQSFASVQNELKEQNTTGIERQAHGWIKNHSLYRR